MLSIVVYKVIHSEILHIIFQQQPQEQFQSPSTNVLSVHNIPLPDPTLPF